MLFRALAIIGALIAVQTPPAAAAAYTAGELQRSTNTSSAAIREKGGGDLRLLVWYPATAAESEVDMGATGDPIFVAGRVAADAAFADRQRHPLILVSHGFGGTARQMTWLGAALARHGYVVAAVDHPGTNGRVGVTAEGAATAWERAGDLEAALNLVLADSVLSPHIDAGRIGVAGFSLGGFTGALEAGARTDFPHFKAFCGGPRRDAICDPQLEFKGDIGQRGDILARPDMRALAARQHDNFRDPRVKAAFLIAPALVQALDSASLTRVPVPVEVLLGDADPIAPPATNGEVLARLVPGARLKVLRGVGHYDFLSECGPAGLKAAKAYCTDGLGTSRTQTHATTTAEAIAFFDATLK